MRGIAAIEHRDVIEMVPCREDIARGNLQNPAKLPEGRALVVVAMGKPQVDRIPLIGKLRQLEALGFQKCDKIMHHLLIGGDHPSQLSILL